jgi:integrase
MPKLNKEFLDQLVSKPGKEQVIYRDDDLQGFALRVTPKSKSYIIEKRVNGINRRVTIGKCDKITFESARKEALKILGDMARGIDPVTGRNGTTYAVTLREVLEKYLAVRKLRPMTKTVYRRLITKELSDWLDIPVTSITRDMIQLRHKEISSGTKYGTTGNATARGTMQTLRAMLNFASDHFGHEEDPLIKYNPVDRLSRDRSWHIIPSRKGIVPDDKLGEWYKAVVRLENIAARDFFLVVALTGMRRTETLTLRWENVNLQERMIFVPGEITKNHRDHHLPMSDFLFDLLRERHHNCRDSQWVFPGRGRGRFSDFRQALQEVRAKSGCQFTVHDLRRTFLTMAEKLEIPHAAIKKLANHCGGNDLTLNYIVQDPERLRAHVNKISNEFVRLFGADIDELLLWRHLDSKITTQDQLRLPISIRTNTSP